MEKLFKTKKEIEITMQIITEWLEKHPDNDKAELAEKLLNRLDYIHMNW